MNAFSGWDIIRNLLLALPWTLALSAIAFVGGSLLAVAMLVLRLWKPATLGRAVGGYVQLFQGTPLLMQLFLTYFGLALVGVETTPLSAATVCLIFYACAYLTETWYGCVRSIPPGQWEASASLGAEPARAATARDLPADFPHGRPAYGGAAGADHQEYVALASVVGFVELTRAGQMIANDDVRAFVVYGLVSLIYFAICFPCSLLGRRLERRTRIQRLKKEAGMPGKRYQPRPQCLPGGNRGPAQMLLAITKYWSGSTLCVQRSEVVSIIGRSGSGRSYPAALYQRPGTVRCGQPVRGRACAKSTAMPMRCANCGKERRHGVPAVQPVPDDELRARTSAAGPAPGAQAARRGRRKLAESCWNAWDWRAASTARRISYRAGSSSASPSRARWP